MISAQDLSRFPVERYDDVDDFVSDYKRLWLQSFDNVDAFAFKDVVTCLENAILEGRTIYACGNGGSAAIANHMVCDFQKGIQTSTALKPQIVSLSSNLELMMAIANDLSYDNVFSYPLRSMAKKGDVLVAISSSGNSKNILEAMTWAKANGLNVVAFTGFDGGLAKEKADITLYVKAHNYGVVESMHHMLMHMIAQYIRHRHMDAELICNVAF